VAAGFTCGASDSICKSIIYQSNCGNLDRWASQNSKTWSIMFRHEIYWKSDCEVSMLDIKATLPRVDVVQGGLLTNLIVNCLANFMLGLFFPICILMNRFKGDVPCIPGTITRAQRVLVPSHALNV